MPTFLMSFSVGLHLKGRIPVPVLSDHCVPLLCDRDDSSFSKLLELSITINVKDDQARGETIAKQKAHKLQKHKVKMKSISIQKVQRSMIGHAFVPHSRDKGISFAFVLRALLYRGYISVSSSFLSSSCYLIVLSVMRI